jgi:hypothetical protein
MSAKAPTILFSEMTPPAEMEDRFNAWYDEHHIPIRMETKGFLSAQRYRMGNERNYLAIYEMVDADVLRSDAYKAIKGNPSTLTKEMLGAVSGFTRYLGTQISERANQENFIDAPVIYPVFFDVPKDRQAEFDAWNEEDHLPILMEDPRWLGVRRFDIYDGEPNTFTRLALHYLSDRAVLESDARTRARATPWRAKLASEPWFKGHYLVFDRLGNRFRGTA